MSVLDAQSISSDRKIQTKRIVPFSPQQVFQAFRDPAVLAQWWGPDGFTNTFHQFQFEPGGMWLFTMHSPDGKDFPNESRFLEISEPGRIVFDHVCPPRFQMQLTFTEHDEGCEIDWCGIFENSAVCANVAKFAGDANEQNLDRLERALQQM